jgi:diguanylate cyclase (GGDEF)-like protein
MEQTPQSVRILLVEDLEADAELTLINLRRAGLHCIAKRVETEPELRAALAEFNPDIVLSDFSLPQFTGFSALEVVRELAPDVPFIFVSGTIGEERAVNALLCGAVDYLLKSNLTRLPSAVRRALAEVEARKQRRLEQAKIARLDRVLRMLSGVNAVMVRVRDRQELLDETCRLAVAVGGYATATVYLESPGSQGVHAQAWSSAAVPGAASLRDQFLQLSAPEMAGLTARIEAGREFVCNDIDSLPAQGKLIRALNEAQLHSLVMLPIFLNKAAIGAWVLTARDAATVSEEELQMLREVAANLSFALQSLHNDNAVHFLSNFDPLTGLAKRALFCERLGGLLSEPAGRRSRYAVVIIDIARLSLINDSFSRRIGDSLLLKVADRLKRRFPQNEHIGHLGGGTFAVILDVGNRSLAEITVTAREQAVGLFGEPFVIEQHQIPLGVCSGIAIYPDHGVGADVLVQNAEAALRNARSSGERQIQYSEGEQTKILERLALEHKLRRALEREEFELHYQPKVNLRTHCIEGVEALLRYRDPNCGLVQPAGFLPVLESTGLIVDVGDWVVRQAARDCQRWLAAGRAPVRIAVNISPSQLKLPDFVDSFLLALAGWSSSGAGLDIEITEGSVQEELSSEVDKLERLRKAGVRIAIDDFGTGYSSLSRLATLPIDILKIDRSFVSELPQSEMSRTLVKTIIDLARAFRLTTVAEGVETREQLEFLRRAGCHQSQGYLHSKPVGREEFMFVLEHGSGSLLRPPGPASDEAAADPVGF